MSRGGYTGGGRPPPEVEGMYSLKIDNISYRTSLEDLRRLFDKYGEIGDIHIPRDRHSRQSRGFAFVRFYKRRDAEYAADKTDGRVVEGREIRVALARYERPIDERERRRDGRGGGGGRDRRSPSRSRSRSRSPRSRSPPPRRPSRSRSRSNSRSRSRSRSGSRD